MSHSDTSEKAENEEVSDDEQSLRDEAMPLVESRMYYIVTFLSLLICRQPLATAQSNHPNTNFNR